MLTTARAFLFVNGLSIVITNGPAVANKVLVFTSEQPSNPSG